MSHPKSLTISAPSPTGLAGYHAGRLGMQTPMTPRGHQFKQISALYSAGIITDADKGTLKDAIISGARIEDDLTKLEGCDPQDRFSIERIIQNVQTQGLASPAMSFSQLMHRDEEESDPFADFGAPKKEQADDWWKSSPAAASRTKTEYTAPAEPVAAVEAPSGGGSQRRGSTTGHSAAGSSFEGSESDSEHELVGHRAPATGPPVTNRPPRPGRSGAWSGDGAASDPYTLASLKPVRLTGQLYIRETSKVFLHKWKRRFVVLDRDCIRVYEREAHQIDGRTPLLTLSLRPNQALSQMKVTSKKPRLFYRHLSELKAGMVLEAHNAQLGAQAAEGKGQHRVFKFGAETQSDFENWTKTIRGCIDRLQHTARKVEADALAVEDAIQPHDIMLTANEAKAGGGFRNRYRRSSLAMGETSEGDVEQDITVLLMDNSPIRVHCAPRATVHDACLDVRKQLGLVADADFSLFVRETSSAGRTSFVCLPDGMSIEDADAAAFADTRALVFKRRLFVPEPPKPPKPGSAAQVMSVDQEELDATSVNDAAHRLAFADALFNTLAGHYCLTLDQMMALGALKLVSDMELKKGAILDVAGVERRLELYISADGICQFAATRSHMTRGELRSALATDLLAEAEPLTSLSAFEAQRRFVSQIRAMPEFGASFFDATLLRVKPSNAGHGSTSAPPVPKWLTAGNAAHHTDPAATPVSVIAGISRKGVHLRPAPPSHEGISSLDAGSLAALASGFHDWYLHPVHHIEVWGVKKTRPVFTYRVREREVMLIELRGAQYQEMAATLHMYVYQLLALREGQERRASRVDMEDRGLAAAAARAADQEAEERAKAHLPDGWSQIKDPISGRTAYWNQLTKETVFARPTT